MSNLVGSPTVDPQLDVDSMLHLCSRMGLSKYEIMTSWVKSAFDIERDPQHYRNLGQKYGLQFTSLHLPPVDDDHTTSLARAIRGARFAHALGVGVVIFKATSRPNYIQTARAFLDAIHDLELTTVVTNHANSPISTLAEYREVLDGVSDSRLKALLEVGHFHKVGVTWREGYDLLAGRIALVHIKDMAGENPVPYGEGEVDFEGLFRHMQSVGYTGDYVFELEKVPRDQVERLMQDGLAFIRDIQANVAQGADPQ